VVPRTSAKSYSKRVWPSCRRPRSAERSAERAGKLSNILEGSGRFRNIRENSGTFGMFLEASRRPRNLYIPLYRSVVYLSVGVSQRVRVSL